MSVLRDGFFDAFGVLCNAGDAGKGTLKGGIQRLFKTRGLFQRAGHIEGKYTDDWKSSGVPRSYQTQGLSFLGRESLSSKTFWWTGKDSTCLLRK